MLFSIRTQAALDHLRQHLPQALLLEGRPGIGLTSAANDIVDADAPASIQHVHPEVSKAGVASINIEQVRGLYTGTRAKHTDRQLTIIHEADSMSLPAQNAFLKLLEEPNSSSYFILLSHQRGPLLPTILSRVQRVTLQPISDDQSNQLLDELSVQDKTKRTQLLFLAAGLPSRLTRLNSDDELFRSEAEVAKDARALLQASRYDRLIAIKRYEKQQPKALALVEACIGALQRTLLQAPSARLVAQLERYEAAYEKLQTNRSVRLTLINLVL